MPRGRPPMPMPIEQIREWAGQLSLEEMAQRLGCSSAPIQKAMVRHGIPRLPMKARPERNHFWNGGRSVDKDGYVLVKSLDHPHRTKHGYVREHRLVMEEVLGRYLTPREAVDHIDGNRSNNDPSNLRVFERNSEHLAATLKGRVPRWSEEGKARILEQVRRPRGPMSAETRERMRQSANRRVHRQRTATLAASESDGCSSR